MDELIEQTKLVLDGKKVSSKNFTKQIAFNAIPHIDQFADDGYTKEELKMMNETKKILDTKIDLTATCVRLPISVSHSESVNLQFEKPFTLEKVRDALNNFEGCKVIDLYCDVDGTFPNHHPNPSEPENLDELIDIVKQKKLDIGLAFDGDGDRVGVIDDQGNVIWADRQMMLYSRDVLSRNPGAKIIFDVKSSRNLSTVIKDAGGEPVMWKTGHSFIKNKMAETGALLAGEMSGHIFFKERWYGFDDALYSAARLLEIITQHPLEAASKLVLPNGSSHLEQTTAILVFL